MLRRVRFSRMLVTALIILLALSTRDLPACAATTTILINEFMPAPSSGAEWVELFNPNPFTVDVSGWRIVDDTLTHTQTTIGPNSILSPNSLLIVFLTTNILNNSGDDAVQLLDTNANVIDSHPYSNATAAQSYARIPDGSNNWAKGAPSQGIWNAQPEPTLVSTYTPSPTNTPGPSGTPMDTPTATPTATAIIPTSSPTATSTPTPSPTATPIPTGIVLNEFLANPSAGNKEWIELYNINSFAVDLTGWKLDI
jgi:hypothetical protein